MKFVRHQTFHPTFSGSKARNYVLEWFGGIFPSNILISNVKIFENLVRRMLASHSFYNTMCQFLKTLKSGKRNGWRKKKTKKEKSKSGKD